MEISFHKTFAPVLRVISLAGLYLPGSDVLYPRHSAVVRTLTYIQLVTSMLIYNTEAVHVFLFLAWGKAEGMTDLFLILAIGILSPTYIFMVYTYWRSRDIEGIIGIWEKDMKNAPYPEDRKEEISKIQRYLFRITRVQVFCFIIPFTMWSSRTLITKKSVQPIVYVHDTTVSPAFELVTLFFCSLGFSISTMWCATENIKLLFMKSILAELNHLYSAADKILTFTTNEEVFETDPDKLRKELRAMEENLRTWIIYHQTVLRFSNKINNFMAPMVLLQDIAALFAFSDLFILMMGDVPLYNAFSGMSYLIFYYYVMYVTNSLGDEIRTKSSIIFETFNGRDYYWYTKSMIKNIIFIQYIASHRPVTLRATWYKSLSRKSLGELSSKGYEIITFMRHLIKRNRM